jgi:cytochrome c oxidase subunit 2
VKGRFAAAVAVTIALAIGAACGGDGDGGSGGGSDSLASGDGPDLAGPAAEGERVAEDRGCTKCHSADGERETGPTWAGLWGSEVDLDEGGTVIADRAYVEQSIRDPQAEVVAGFTPIMPEIPLSDAEIDQLVAYIEALG